MPMIPQQCVEHFSERSATALFVEEADDVAAVLSGLLDVITIEVNAVESVSRAEETFTDVFRNDCENQASCESNPCAASSTSERDDTAESVIAMILAKLNDPQAKLNRRERRALQRQLDIAKGVQKPYPIPQSTNDDIVVGSEFSELTPIATGGRSREGDEAIRQKWQERSKSSSKRPVDGGGECQAPLPKIAKVQNLVPPAMKSVFNVGTASMVQRDSATKPFESTRMSYVCPSLPANNFLKLCRFSPSGSFIATTSADNMARIFELDEERKMSLVAKIPLGDPIYDANWLCGGADKQLIATTAKHHPIHLWCSDGARYASYRGINHLDELSAAYSIAFSNDGRRLYGGHNANIWIWDTDRPGRQHTTIKTWERQTGGQKSIISCIAMNKSFDGVYAVATYSGSVGFYSDRSNSLECMFSTESTAITDMHYSYDGQRLYVAPRKDGEILCYDMRMPGNILFKMLRPFTTNQRTCFDVERWAFNVFSTLHEDKSPLVALCTGERVFPKPRISRSSSSGSDSDDDRIYRNRRHDKELNNSLQLWAFEEAAVQ
ncbi:WD domain, G-beta repeat protein [Ostertagia ostertagi]